MRNDRMPGFLEKLTRICGFEMALADQYRRRSRRNRHQTRRAAGDTRSKASAENAAEIVVFSDNFHGRTISAISASTTAEYRKEFGPFVPGFVWVPFGDADALERAIKPETCAILIEPIQGEGGVNVPPEGYLKRAWALCREHRALFIADEIQTGFGRTGDLFACDYDGIKPDVLLVGKAFGGGYYPVSATLADESLMRLFQPGEHGSTFGGNPLACAVAEAALDVFVDEKLASNARYAGAKIMQGLRAMGSPLIEEVRGRGLLIGIELTIPARHLSDALLERGVAAKDTHEMVLRIAPPLAIDDAAIDYLLERFRDAVTSVA